MTNYPKWSQNGSNHREQIYKKRGLKIDAKKRNARWRVAGALLKTKSSLLASSSSPSQSSNVFSLPVTFSLRPVFDSSSSHPRLIFVL